MAARRLLAEGEAAAPATAEADYRMKLVARVHGPGGGLAVLSTPERQYFLLLALSTQLEEGSIFSFFDNAAADHHPEVADLLHGLGLGRMAQGLQQAKEVLFGEGAVPGDVGSRRKSMPTNRQGEPRREARKALDAIDRDTRGAEHGIQEAMRAIAHANALF